MIDRIDGKGACKSVDIGSVDVRIKRLARFICHHRYIYRYREF